MSLRDQQVNKTANFGKKQLAVALITAISQTGVTCYSFTPGYKFQLLAVGSFCEALAGTVTAQVFVGGRLAASVTFTSATEVAQTLSTTLANLKGSATDAITIQYTTNGSGVLTNGFINIVYRPWPYAGDLGPV